MELKKKIILWNFIYMILLILIVVLLNYFNIIKFNFWLNMLLFLVIFSCIFVFLFKLESTLAKDFIKKMKSKLTPDEYLNYLIDFKKSIAFVRSYRLIKDVKSKDFVRKQLLLTIDEFDQYQQELNNKKEISLMEIIVAVIISLVTIIYVSLMVIVTNKYIVHIDIFLTIIFSSYLFIGIFFNSYYIYVFNKKLDQIPKTDLSIIENI
jgi:hypothetical protein